VEGRGGGAAIQLENRDGAMITGILRMEETDPYPCSSAFIRGSVFPGDEWDKRAIGVVNH
jgi:hypothetical protein